MMAEKIVAEKRVAADSGKGQSRTGLESNLGRKEESQIRIYSKGTRKGAVLGRGNSKNKGGLENGDWLEKRGGCRAANCKCVGQGYQSKMVKRLG